MSNREPLNMAYIICTRKKSRPKVSKIICESCKRMGKCQDYKNHIQPSLFPDSIKTLSSFRRRPKNRNTKPKAETAENNTIQLLFDF